MTVNFDKKKIVEWGTSIEVALTAAVNLGNAKVYDAREKLPRYTPSLLGDAFLNRAVYKATEELKIYGEDLMTFRRQMADDPVSALSGSHGAFAAAGKVQLARWVLAEIKKAEEQNDGYQGGSGLNTVRGIHSNLLRDVVNDVAAAARFFSTQSTEMDRAVLTAKAFLLADLSRLFKQYGL